MTWSVKCFVLAIAMATSVATLPARARAQQRGGQPPRQAIPPLGLDSTEDEIQRTVNAVRAGRKLTPKAWPNGARVAVGLSFDIDNELLSRTNPLPIPLSQGEYGATTGLPRILAMLDRQQVPATFYIPAVSAMLHPDMIPAIMKSGRHEIGVHGWIHEFLPSVGDAAREERLLTQAIDVPDQGDRQASGRLPGAVVGVQPVHAVADPQGRIPL